MKGDASTNAKSQMKLKRQTFRCQKIAVWESNLTLSANHTDRATITLSAITRMLSALITVPTHILKDSGYILFGLVAPTSGIFSTA